MITPLDNDNINYQLNNNIRNRIQIHLREYICTGYKIYNLDDNRIKKTKAYRKYMNIREKIFLSRYKNIILNMVGQKMHRIIKKGL